jgi:hypothetical protein
MTGSRKNPTRPRHKDGVTKKEGVTKKRRGDKYALTLDDQRYINFGRQRCVNFRWPKDTLTLVGKDCEDRW